MAIWPRRNHGWKVRGDHIWGACRRLHLSLSSSFISRSTIVSIFYFSMHVIFSYSAFRLQECSIKINQSINQSITLRAEASLGRLTNFWGASYTPSPTKDYSNQKLEGTRPSGPMGWLRRFQRPPYSQKHSFTGYVNTFRNLDDRRIPTGGVGWGRRGVNEGGNRIQQTVRWIIARLRVADPRRNRKNVMRNLVITREILDAEWRATTRGQGCAYRVVL